MAIWGSTMGSADLTLCSEKTKVFLPSPLVRGGLLFLLKSVKYALFHPRWRGPDICSIIPGLSCIWQCNEFILITYYANAMRSIILRSLDVLNASVIFGIGASFVILYCSHTSFCNRIRVRGVGECLRFSPKKRVPHSCHIFPP